MRRWRCAPTETFDQDSNRETHAAPARVGFLARSTDTVTQIDNIMAPVLGCNIMADLYVLFPSSN